jgi:hypothetical protein
MTNQEYSRLVDHFTNLWRTNPRAHQRSIGLFSLLGIVVLAFAFVLAIVLVLTFKPLLVIAGVVILYSIGKAIFYRPEEPGGVRLNREMAPTLFEDVDDICRKLGARRCDGIRLDFDFNAAAVQFHKWGVVGPIRNYVLLGMPLLDCLSRDQVRSVIAHEVGHLMLKHGARNRRWYAMAEMYAAIRENLKGGLLWYLFGPFADWYLPRFYARLQPISLRSEFEADARAVAITSASVAASSLCMLRLGEKRVDNEIRTYCTRATSENNHDAEQLADAVYASVREWSDEEASTTLSRALRAATDIEGSHPALADRLAALGVEPEVPTPAKPAASDEYFGSERRSVAAGIAHHYMSLSGYYESLVEAIGEAKEVESSISARVMDGTASQEEIEDYVRTQGFMHGPDHVQHHIERYLVQYPQSSALHYYQGMTQLKQGDDEGIHALVKSAHLGEGISADIFETIYQYLLANGRTEEASEFRQKRDQFVDQLSSTYDSRLKVSKKQEYEPAGFAENEIEYIREILSRAKAVGKAYIVKRSNQDGPLTMYDLAVFPRRFRIVVDGDALRSDIEEAVQDIGRAITVFFGPWLIESVRNRMQSVEGSLVYDYDAKREESRSASMPAD